MTTRKNTRQAAYTNEQARAAEFRVGQQVVHWGKSLEESGRVTAVWPAIGQIDVQYPWGNIRVGVEEVQIVSDESWVEAPHTEDVPGGAGTVPVSGGPFAQREASANRVVQAYVKQAIYWHQKDRKYRVSQGETDNGEYYCPKCKEVVLKNAIYKREEGQSVKLLGCPSCLFLVRLGDLVGIDSPGVVVEKVEKEEKKPVPAGSSAMLSFLRGK
jgi:hypothetical protein